MSGASKIYEKLEILAENCTGLLTRVYNCLRTFDHPDSRPKVLSDKSCLAPLKELLKRFPSYPSLHDTEKV